jgi:phosphoserine phosphatase RsbU/P
MNNSDRHKLLVVDENPAAINALQKFLDVNRYELVTTHDGEEGFRLLMKDPHSFHAVILGKSIQNITSIKLLHRINSSSNIKVIPVIMEADADSVEEMQTCIRAGARYYIPLPIEGKILPQVIAAAMRDQLRYSNAQKKVEETKAIGEPILRAEFSIRTLEEAQTVGNVIAAECPNPRLAVVGITEMLINAIEHGNLNISYHEKTKLQQSETWLQEIARRLTLPEYKERRVAVKFEKVASHINIRITDQGNGFNWRDFQNLDNKRVFDNHGRGIIMARSLAFESMIYHGNGNDVECIIPIA